MHNKREPFVPDDPDELPCNIGTKLLRMQLYHDPD